MFREKWTWLALGMLIAFAGVVLTNAQVNALSRRVNNLERYLPYLTPASAE